MSDSYNPQLTPDEYTSLGEGHKVPLTGFIKGPEYEADGSKGEAEQSSNKDIMEG